MKKTLLLIIIISGFAKAQNSKIDSLLSLVKTTGIDSLKLNSYIRICDLCEIKDNLKYGHLADSLATKLIKQSKSETERLNFTRKKIYAYNTIMVYYRELNNNDSVNSYQKRVFELAKMTKNINLIFETNAIYIRSNKRSNSNMALQLAYENLELSKKAKNCKLISKAYSLIANVNFWGIGNNSKAFEYYELAIYEAERCNDKETLLKIYSECENPYFNTKKYEIYRQLLLKKEKIEPKLKEDCWHIASFGDLFRNIKKLDTADIYYKKAISLAERQKDSASIMQLYNNYALIPDEQGDYKTAIKYCQKGLLIAERLKSKRGIRNSHMQLSEMFRHINDWSNAKYHLMYLVKEAESYKEELDLIGYYRNISEIEFKLHNYKNAYDYLLKNIELFEKHNNAEKTSGLIKTEEVNVKKQKQLEIDLANEQKENERKVKNISFIALSVSLILICGILLMLLKIRKSNKIIISQKQEVETQKHIVDEKQKEILDSITYAKRLQQAILPPQEFVNTHIANNFIYYQPKDIVAGDFYWAEKVGDLFFIAAADSTGHGVPGAMVSVVCSNALNRTIKEFKLTETGKILDKTRDLVIETFEKSASEVKDGMDISLLCIDYKNKNIFWSGANNPLWYIQDDTLVEIKADKQPIGKTDNPRPFTTHQIEFKENITFYLFTDGLADQFGGPNGKKFKYKQFSDLLIGHHHLSQAQQADIINEAFLYWKGALEQVDDVCVIGIKI